MNPLVYIVINGNMFPAPPSMLLNFCTEAAAKQLMPQITAILPNAVLSDDTDKQTYGNFAGPSFFTPGDIMRFWQISGSVTDKDNNSIPVMENVGMLLNRKTNRLIYAGIDNSSGDNLKLAVLPVGIAQMYWGS